MYSLTFPRAAASSAAAASKPLHNALGGKAKTEELRQQTLQRRIEEERQYERSLKSEAQLQAEAAAQAKAEARAADRKGSVKTRVGATTRPKPPAPRLSEGARQEKPVGKNGGKSSVGGGVGSCTSTITGKSMLQHQMAAVTARAE